MARMRASSGGSGWAVATVLLGFGFILCLIMAIVFRTQIGGAQQSLDDLERDTNSYVSRADKNSLDIASMRDLAQEQRPKQSLAQYMRDQIRWLKTKISSPDASQAGIENQLKNLGVSEGKTLIGEVERVVAELTAASDWAEAAEKALGVANERIKAVEAEKGELAKRFDQSAAEIREQVIAMQSALDLYKSTKDEQVALVEGHLKLIRDETGDTIKEQASRIAQFEEESRKLRNEVRTLTRGTTEPALVDRIEPDGYIASLAKDTNLVYINLSREDRVLPGMTFEIFPQNILVKLEDVEENRGIATIEVVRPLDNATLCRIVRRQPRKVVAVDDQIVNIVYGPNSVYRFFVHGAFDLDNVGRATMADHRRVEAMIARWGGSVPDQVDYQIDYLVVGQAPGLPQNPPDEAPPRVLEDYQRQLARYQEHQGLVTLAEKLNIPVLNQNRFLALVGYYQR